jgi:hypothetical protein
LSDDLFLCEVSKGSAVWSEFNIFCTLVTMATAAIFNFFNPSKATTHYGGHDDFSKMAAVAMETAKMLKKMKNTKMIIAGYSPNRN